MINAPAGEWENGQRGLASLPDAGEPFRHSVRLAREYAVALGCKQIHIMAGNREESITFDEQYALLIERLRYAADYLMADNIRVLIEPLNNDNMPGYFISSFPLAENNSTSVRERIFFYSLMFTIAKNTRQPMGQPTTLLAVNFTYTDSLGT